MGSSLSISDWLVVRSSGTSSISSSRCKTACHPDDPDGWCPKHPQNSLLAGHSSVPCFLYKKMGACEGGDLGGFRGALGQPCLGGEAVSWAGREGLFLFCPVEPFCLYATRNYSGRFPPQNGPFAGACRRLQSRDGSLPKISENKFLCVRCGAYGWDVENYLPLFCSVLNE